MQPELQFFNAFMRKVLPLVVIGAMIFGAVAASNTQDSPIIAALITAPPAGIACALLCYGLGYLFFRMQAGHCFEAFEDGLQVKTSDFDDRIPWQQITDVCHRGNNMHINTTVRSGSMEMHFVDPAQADRLYRLHYERVGFARGR